MVKRIMFLGCVFVSVSQIQAMNYGRHNYKHPSLSVKMEAGLLCAGTSIALLASSPENSLHANCLNSMGILLGLDLLNCRKRLYHAATSLVGASLWAAQTKDANRSVTDHIRALAAGGLMSGGLWECCKSLYQHNVKGSLIGLGALAAGALLVSQKDIKILLGKQEGISLNPPLEVKECVKKDFENAQKKIEIRRQVLEMAQQGRSEAMPFLYRIKGFLFEVFKQGDKDLMKKTVYITRQKLVDDILPYLRIENHEKLEENLVTVFSVDKNTNGWLAQGNISPYLK